MSRIMELNGEELLELARRRVLAEREALEILRNPYCTVEVAEAVTEQRKALSSHKVRELLCGFRGFSFSRAVDLIATLPWTSLLELAKNPRTPTAVRRQAEGKLLQRIPKMTLGEKTALTRIAHRPLFNPLMHLADGDVLSALLDNPRLVENDVLVVVNRVKAPTEFYRNLAAHRRWGQYCGVRKALAACPRSPLPLALSLLVQLNAVDLKSIIEHPETPGRVKTAAEGLLVSRRRRGKVLR